MNFVFAFLSLCLSTLCYAQNLNDLDKYSIDTLQPLKLTTKKVVAFKHGNLIYQVNYDDYKLAIKVYRKKYLKEYDYLNGTETRLREVDTLLKKMSRVLRRNDTVYLTQRDVTRFGIYPTEEFIANQIDRTNCLVFDSDKLPVKVIIRIKGGYSKGTKDAWSGTRYFLLGQDLYFLEITTNLS